MYKHGVLLIGLLGCLCIATAHPYFWVTREEESTCEAMPSKKEGDHLAPKNDPDTSLTITDAKGMVVKSVCPGASYSLNITYPEKRESLVITSIGTLDDGAGEVLKSLFQCPNRFVSPKMSGGAKSESLAITWAVPCNTTGSAKVLVTSATGSTSAFLMSSLTANVSALADCPTSTCRDAVAVTAPKNMTGASATNATTAAPAAADTVAAAPPSPEPAKTKGAADSARPMAALAVAAGALLAALLA